MPRFGLLSSYGMSITRTACDLRRCSSLVQDEAAVPASKRFPDFIYIGGPRCGSTWLAAVLSDHPNVYIPPSKEIHFFNDRMPYRYEYRYHRGLDYYSTFFDGAKDDQICGDMSPLYFMDPAAGWRMRRALPDVRILSFLRDPVDMLYSLYLLLRQREKRADTFEGELERNPQLIDICRYDRMLQTYYDVFPAQQIKVMLHDDVGSAPAQVARDVYRFIGVDEDFVPPSLEKKFNLATDKAPKATRRSRRYAIAVLNHPLMLPVKQILLRGGFKDVRHLGQQDRDDAPRYKGVQPETRAWMADMLRPDLERLEARLERDLSMWPTRQAGKRTRKQRAPLESIAS